MRIDWTEKLQNLLQTLAFCLAIATVQWGFQPERPYAPLVVYSVCIGVLIWAVIDIGRHGLPSASETGWPTGLRGVLLVAAGIGVGYLGGHRIADQLCRLFDFYGPGPRPDPVAELRSSLLITVLAGIAGSFWFHARHRGAFMERKIAETRRQADEARLKLLEAQLEPHMLFNTLANLRVLIAVDPQRAQVMLDHMIAWLRATLAGSRTVLHPLQAEFDRLRDYLELMAIRMGPRLAFSLDLPPALAQAQVPAMLLQPLVENAIQHGLEPQVAGGSIAVTAAQDGRLLVIEVRDTGAGLAEAPPAKGRGFGVVQVRERLQTLYGDAGSLTLQRGPQGGTVATVRMPLPGGPP